MKLYLPRGIELNVHKQGWINIQNGSSYINFARETHGRKSTCALNIHLVLTISAFKIGYNTHRGGGLGGY